MIVNFIQNYYKKKHYFLNKHGKYMVWKNDVGENTGLWKIVEWY